MPQFYFRQIKRIPEIEYNTELEISPDPEPESEPENTSDFLEIH
jgi:hypothetical protein